MTATFDAQGRLVKEGGGRAPDMTTPVAGLLRPLPAGATAPEPRLPTSRARAEGLRRIHPDAQPDDPDGSAT